MKMSHYNGIQTQHDWCPYKKRKVPAVCVRRGDHDRMTEQQEDSHLHATGR